jgi:hypothetical protein
MPAACECDIRSMRAIVDARADSLEAIDQALQHADKGTARIFLCKSSKSSLQDPKLRAFELPVCKSALTANVLTSGFDDRYVSLPGEEKGMLCVQEKAQFGSEFADIHWSAPDDKWAQITEDLPQDPPTEAKEEVVEVEEEVTVPVAAPVAAESAVGAPEREAAVALARACRSLLEDEPDYKGVARSLVGALETIMLAA